MKTWTEEDYRLIANESYRQFSNGLKYEYQETYPLIPINDKLVIDYEGVTIEEPTIDFIDMKIDERCTCNKLAHYFDIKTGRSYCEGCKNDT